LIRGRAVQIGLVGKLGLQCKGRQPLGLALFCIDHMMNREYSPQICTIFLSRYRAAYSNRMFIMSPSTSLLTYLQKWRQVLFNGVDRQSVVVST